MSLNDPDPHTGHPMGSYRQDPTGRHQPLSVSDRDEMSQILGQGIWLGVGALLVVLFILGFWLFR